jgi:hypothetical protein
MISSVIILVPISYKNLQAANFSQAGANEK